MVLVGRLALACKKATASDPPERRVYLIMVAITIWIQTSKQVQPRPAVCLSFSRKALILLRGSHQLAYVSDPGYPFRPWPDGPSGSRTAVLRY